MPFLPAWASLLQDGQKCLLILVPTAITAPPPRKKSKEQSVSLPRFTAYYWIVGVCVPPPNSCLRVVLLADLHVGGAQAVIYGLRGPSEVARLTDPAGCVCVAGDRAVWPPAQRPAEALSAALPVLQPPPPDQGAVPLPHLGLLQQRAQQGDPAAGDELRAAGDLHPGKRQDWDSSSPRNGPRRF